MVRLRDRKVSVENIEELVDTPLIWFDDALRMVVELPPDRRSALVDVVLLGDESAMRPAQRRDLGGVTSFDSFETRQFGLRGVRVCRTCFGLLRGDDRVGRPYRSVERSD